MKRRRKQYTCRCGAYDFPHRFSGGRCQGLWLVEPNHYCPSCNLLTDSGCQVINGIEHPRECPLVQDFCNHHEVKL